MSTLTIPTNTMEDLNHGAQTCEAAAYKAEKQRSEQLKRLRSCIHKELTFRVKRGSNGRAYIPRRHAVPDGYPKEKWGMGEPSFCPHPYDGAEFTATVTRVGIDNRGCSYVVVGVGATQEINQQGNSAEYLREGYEYQLSLDRIAVVGGLD